MPMQNRIVWLTACMAMVLACMACATAQAADPEEAQYNVVVTLYNAGQWKAALKKIDEREALTLTDDMRARYMYARGLVLEKGAQTGDAQKAYAALIAKFPAAGESDKARLALVFSDHAGKNFEDLIARVAEIRQDRLSAAEKQQLSLMLGEAWSSKGEARKALDAYQEALKLGADPAALRPRLFAAYHQLQMHKELVEISSAGVAGLDPAVLATTRAEALLALGKYPEAEAEARKVSDEGPYAGRAAYAQAQALIRQNRLSDAAAPLEIAIRLLRDPPAPASAYLALADCQVAAGKSEAAAQTLEKAVSKIRALPEAERKPLLEQMVLARIHLASASKDMRALANAVEEARSALPAERLPAIFYARLFALQEKGDDAEILKSFTRDFALFESKPEEIPAALIYFEAFRRKQRSGEGIVVLEKLLARRPAGPETAKVRFTLANAILVAEDFPKALEHLKILLAIPDVMTHLGAASWGEAMYNSAVAALRGGDTSSALQTLSALSQQKPDPELAARALLLQGQIHAQANDFKNAVTAWRQALAQGKELDRADLQDRLGRALLAAGDASGARQEFQALAKQAGGAEKLKRETLEAWARADYEAGDYAAASEAYQRLYTAYPDAPVYAFECAVAFEQLSRWPEAETWYATAGKNRARLPADYAKVLDRNLSAVRFRSGTGDMGADYWMSRLTAEASDADFDGAVTALAGIADRARMEAAGLARIQKIHDSFPADAPRHYSVGAVRLLFMAAQKDWSGSQRLAGKLATEYSAREKSFTVQTWATTVAPAIIHFVSGEANRQLGNAADALVAYETLLSAYPVNEWPEAAAYGAAECYLALGDAKTAIAKLNDVIKNGGTNPAAARWVEQARKRVKELEETLPGK